MARVRRGHRSNRPASGGIGEAVLRKEDAEFITGQGRFVDDLVLPGMLHSAFVRSPFGHAVVTAIDTSAAEGMPGVVTIITAETSGWPAACRAARTRRAHPAAAASPPREVASGTTASRSRSSPPTRYAAGDAAAAVLVEYDPLPGHRAREALRRTRPAARGVRPDLCCTLAHETDGFAEAFAQRRARREGADYNQRLTPVAIETRGVVADYVPATGEVTLYTSTQVPHFVRTFVAVINETSEAKVRVVAPDVGGGFGSKLNIYPEEFAAVAASKRRRRAGEVDRGPEREHPRDDPRPRPVAVHEAARRRPRARCSPSSSTAREHRRLPAAADAVDPAPDAVHGARPVRDPARIAHDRPRSRTRRRPTRTAARAGRRPRTGSSG